MIFYDVYQVRPSEIAGVLRPYPSVITLVSWPWEPTNYTGFESDEKFGNPQRFKMLSGFVHVPPEFVQTEYWLKVDTDTIATGMDDWINPKWFETKPAMAVQKWRYTKPGDQMLRFDQWVENSDGKLPELSMHYPLNLVPNEGSSILRHTRIISWCGFFRTDFCHKASLFASRTCESCTIPQPSQDGYLWYVAERLGEKILTPNMKKRGWKHRSSTRGIKEAIEEAMNGQQHVAKT